MTHQEKREKNQINKIRNEKVEVTTDNAEIQRIVRDYYEQLYDNKMDNQEEIENLNRPITSMEIETVIKNLPTKSQDHMASQVNSAKNLEKS